MPTLTERELADIMAANPDLGPVCPPEPPSPNAARVAGQSEHALQAAIVAECARRAVADARWGYVYHPANGEWRAWSTAVRLKQAGVQRGVPDLALPVAARGYVGFWMELKISPNKLSEDQERWGEFLRSQGAFVACVWDSLPAAVGLIEWYLAEGVGV